MGRRRSRFLLAALFFLLANEASAGGGEPPSFPVFAKLEIASGETVGMVSAGMLCLPKGILRVRDFVWDDEDLTSVLREALAELHTGQRQDGLSWSPRAISVTLTGIRAKLCARKWGVFGTGDTKSLAGEVLRRVRVLKRNA